MRLTLLPLLAALLLAACDAPPPPPAAAEPIAPPMGPVVSPAPTRFTLTAQRAGSGEGRISSTPAGLDCGSACSLTADRGSRYTLTATPAANSRFEGWGGACSGTASSCELVLNADAPVSAVFSRLEMVTVTVTKSGDGGGTVTSNPQGIDCGATCAFSVAKGSVVNLSTVAAAGSEFTGWQGGTCSGAGACQFTANANTSITSVLSKIPSFPLTVTRTGVGIGSVTSSPAGINCGSSCTAEFDRDRQMTLSALEAAGSQFEGWSGACTGLGACNVVMSKAQTVMANFSLIPVAVGETYEAGAAKRVISPTADDIACKELDADGNPQCFSLGGYGTRELGCDPAFDQGCVLSNAGPATGVFHPIHIRAVVIKKGTTQVVLINQDAIGAGNIILNNLRAAVNAATGIPVENVLIAETHTHSASDLQGLWGGVPQRFRNALYASAAAAVKEAQTNLRPARLFTSAARINFNNYRRPKPDDPNDPNAVYVTDKTMTVLQARDAINGSVIGTVVQYSAHPTVLGDSNRLVHTDYVGSMEDATEARYGGTMVYYNGVIADASPRAPDPDASFTGLARNYERARLMGVALAEEIRKLVDLGVELPVKPLFVRQTNVVLPVTNPVFLGAGGIRWFDGYYNFTDPTSGQSGYVATMVSRVRIGDATDVNKKLEIVSIPGEATGPFGRMIRNLAAGPYTMLCGLTHNSLGYILPRDEFGRVNENDGPTRLDDCISSMGGDCEAPDTPYEETVSLGPATAPLLEELGYNVLFDDSLPTTPPPPTP